MAKHINHIEWLDNVDTLDTDLGKTVFREFLLCSPALEVSARSKGWISRFGINDSDDAEILFDELTRDVRVIKSDGSRYATSASEVERLLCTEGLIAGEFWNAASFIVYTVPNEAKTQVNKAVEAATDGNTLFKDKKKTLIKDNYLQVDALFRHLRNAIAHGAFQIKEVDSGKRICVFQDASNSGDLSARLVIKEKTLREWIAAFRRYEQQGV
mgnify:FL=1